MQVVFTVQAERDLEEIGDYIAIDNPSRAVSFVREIREHSRHRAPGLPPSLRAGGLRGGRRCELCEDVYAQYLKHRPKVVLMDLTMPGMGGFESIWGRSKAICI